MVALGHARGCPGPLRHPLLRRLRSTPCKPVPDRGEVDEARWLGPAGALEEHAADRLELSFPTVKHLEELTGFADADAVIAEGAHAHVEAITPSPPPRPFEVLLPGDPGFADE